MLFVFEFSNILKDFSRLKVVSVSSSFEGVCLEDHRCYSQSFQTAVVLPNGKRGKRKSSRLAGVVSVLFVSFFFLQTTDQKKVQN